MHCRVFAEKATNYALAAILVVSLAFDLVVDGKELPAELSKAMATGVVNPLEMQCPPCEQIHCTPRRASRLKCKGGVTLGICNCCPVCAKVEGEMCDGAWDYLGKCDRGLYCHVDVKEASPLLNIAAKVQQKPEGICRKCKYFIHLKRKINMNIRASLHGKNYLYKMCFVWVI